MSIGERLPATEEIRELSQQIKALAHKRDEAVRQLGLLQEQLDPLQHRLEMLNELMRDRLQE
jgi:uncharacterized coiled-coil DUF342 family protein